MLPKFNLNLDKATGEKPVMVFHSIHFKGNRFRIATGYRISPAHWDRVKQEVKRTRPNFGEINRALIKQFNELEKVCIQLSEKGNPINKETICTRLSFYKATGTQKEKDFSLSSFFEEFIKEYGRDKGERTLKGYKTAINHLKAYLQANSRPDSFECLNGDFYHHFRLFLELPDNTFGQHIKNLKVFAKWAFEKGLFETEFWRKWKVTEEKKEQFFLKWEEVKKIETLELDERLSKVRDMFLLGCYTGLSYSDLTELSPKHLNGQTIIKHRAKTGTLLTIPVNDKAGKILSKYWDNKKPLPTISNQKGNEYIKEIGKKAGFTHLFNYVQSANGKRTETALEAWEMMHWHTARHTFITNCIHLGVSPEAVRRIVGHSSFKMLEKYIQNNPDFLQKEIRKLF
jgi:integrase